MDIAEIKTEKGLVRIADKALAAIARRACLSAEGVAAMDPRYQSGIPSMIVGTDAEGVHVVIHENKIEVALYIWVHHGYRVPEIALRVQEAVKEALKNTSGLPVVSVDIFVEKIVFGGSGGGV